MKQFLKDIIAEAGKIALDHKAHLGQMRVEHKSDKDLVTAADVAVENYLLEQIQMHYPEHAILGEESDYP